CAEKHCGADGICAEACVAPRDPDCAAMDMNNCGDNGVCDLTCPMDPDCVRDVGSPVDAGAREAGPVDAFPPPIDAVTRDAGSADEPIGTPPDAAILD